jgi:hypothetical protein
LYTLLGDDSDQAQAYEQYQSSEPHAAKISHELIAAAASYEAAKAYENHVAANGLFCPVALPCLHNKKDGLVWYRNADLDIGPPPSHEKAKEILAGLAGAFIDREVEAKGLDFIDREQAKRHAKEQLAELSAAEYA